MGLTILKVVLLFWSHFTIVFADYVCVCSNHIGAKIYPSPDTHTMPIGTLYPDIGECKPAYNDTSHPHFVALVHFHQIGYVVHDKDIHITNCVGHPNSADDLLTTLLPLHITRMTTIPAQFVTATSANVYTNLISTHKTHPMTYMKQVTTFQATSTAPQGGCNKVALFMDIALDKNVGTTGSFHCNDHVHFHSGGVIRAFCGAPDKSRWLKGRKVVDFPSAVQKYSPIGTFDNSDAYKGNAGVYLGYLNATLFMVTQTCYTNLEIIGASASSSPHVEEYFEIIW